MNSLNLGFQNKLVTSHHLSSRSHALGGTKTLDSVANGEQFVVQRLVATGASAEWLQQLEDLGFIAGEPVTIMARGAFGGDPLVVRIGLSTFALRKAEAACVQVELPREKWQSEIAA
ncbi:MAG: ferrous iron transport protein A [Undibacterium sp.]|nr:ferrous iron transport protein A [Undibacterium sp.]